MTCLQSERNKHDRIDTRALNERAPQVSARDVIEESSQRILVSNGHTRGTEEDGLTLLKRSMLCNASRITPRPPTTSHFFFGPWSDRLLEPIRTRSTSVPVFECIVEVLVAVLNLARHCCFIFFSLYTAVYNALLLEKLSLSPYIYTLCLCVRNTQLAQRQYCATFTGAYRNRTSKFEHPWSAFGLRGKFAELLLDPKGESEKKGGRRCHR